MPASAFLFGQIRILFSFLLSTLNEIKPSGDVYPGVEKKTAEK